MEVLDSKELLNGIINDMTDAILDYQETYIMVSDKMLKIVYKTRVDLLKEWVYSLKQLLAELE